MLALPFPQQQTTIQRLSFLFATSRTPDGSGTVFKFQQRVTPITLPAGSLARIVSVGITSNVPTSAYLQAATNPEGAAFVLQDRAGVPRLQRPFPAVWIGQEIPWLEYVRPSSRMELTGSLSLVLDGDAPEMVGIARAVVVVGMTLQICEDSDWIRRFDGGDV